MVRAGPLFVVALLLLIARRCVAFIRPLIVAFLGCVWCRATLLAVPSELLFQLVHSAGIVTTPVARSHARSFLGLMLFEL